MSMPMPRDPPYVWVSGLAKLIAGETHCLWALWFGAHNRYDKRPSDFDTATWTARHAELVRDRADILQGEGYEVHLEDQNWFALQGHTGILSGKPDIIAVKGEKVLVIDCKTGAPKGSDCIQVVVYMLALPLVRPAWVGKVISGEVRYSNRYESIGSDEMSPGLQGDIWKAVRRLTSNVAPARTPSIRECRFCNITVADCPDRAEAPTALEVATCDLF